MQTSDGYRIAKGLQRLGALGAEADRVLVVRTVINQQLAPSERATLLALIQQCDAEQLPRLAPRDCTKEERAIIRRVIALAGQRPRHD